MADRICSVETFGPAWRKVRGCRTFGSIFHPDEQGLPAGTERNLVTQQNRGDRRRVSHQLVAMSSAAVLAVYSAGYLRTQDAAARLAADASTDRRPSPAVESVPTQQPETVTALDDQESETTATVGEPVEVPPQPTTSVTEVPSAAPAVGPGTSERRTPSDHDSATVAVVDAPVPAPVVNEAPVEVGPVASAVPAVETPAPAPAAATMPKYKDGTYTGWGTSRHGDIQARVVIVEGRITSATIAQCMTRWPCSWIEPLPPQVVERQSPETDFVSGATQSTNAFYYGVVQALGKAALP